LNQWKERKERGRIPHFIKCIYVYKGDWLSSHFSPFAARERGDGSKRT
jgi:hypothetical protein